MKPLGVQSFFRIFSPLEFALCLVHGCGGGLSEIRTEYSAICDSLLFFPAASNVSHHPSSGLNRFLVPKINFRLDHDYDEILCQQLLTIRDRTLMVAEASTRIEFVLDEYGVPVKSSSFWGTEEADPLGIIFSRTFLHIMKQKNSHLLLFSAWLGNSELLSKF